MINRKFTPSLINKHIKFNTSPNFHNYLLGKDIISPIGKPVKNKEKEMPKILIHLPVCA